MNDTTADSEKGFKKRLFLPVLALAVFSTVVIDIVLPLLLTDIAKSFQVTVGTASTIASFSSIIGVIIGLFMALLSVRFKHKYLLLIGVLCICISALGSFLAPSLFAMQIFNSLNAVGSVMVAALAYSILGDFYPIEKKGKAIGWMVAAGFLGFIVGSPMAGIIAPIGGWRSVMLWFILPVSLVCLFLALLVLPSKPIENRHVVRTPIFAGYRQALSNKSAAACLVGVMFIAGTATITFFVISFWKTQFAMDTSTGAVLTMINASSAALGGIFAGRIVNRTGPKTLGVTTGLVTSTLVVLTVLMPTLLSSWVVSVVRVWFYGMLVASLATLTLEQIPKFRGTMMSLRAAFGGAGSFLGVTLGGISLNMYNYQILGIVLGVLGMASITVILLFAKDPYKNPPPQSELKQPQNF